MLKIIFFLSLMVAVITAGLGIKKSPKWYWAAGLSMYIFSFLGSMSIGIYSLSLAFVFFILAIAYSVSAIKSAVHVLASIGIGFLIWFAAIKMIDDALLFLPFSLIF